MAVTTTQRSRPGSRHPHRRGGGDSANSQVLGAVLVLGGIGWFLQQTGLLQLSLTTTLSCLLITLGVGLVLTARRSGGAGLVVLGIALTIVLASASAVDASLLQRGAGERTFSPATVSALEERYQLGAGSLTLDLTDLPAEELAGKRIDVQVGVGELVVLLPPKSELGVDVRAVVRAGELDLPERDGTDDGTNLTERVRDTPVDGAALLELDLDVGLGTVQVVRPRAG